MGGLMALQMMQQNKAQDDSMSKAMVGASNRGPSAWMQAAGMQPGQGSNVQGVQMANPYSTMLSGAGMGLKMNQAGQQADQDKEYMGIKKDEIAFKQKIVQERLDVEKSKIAEAKARNDADSKVAKSENLRPVMSQQQQPQQQSAWGGQFDLAKDNPYLQMLMQKNY